MTLPTTFTERQVLMMKVATAISVLRSKPSDQSAREYTEKLQAGVRQNEETWKEKVATLEREVALLKKELPQDAAERKHWECRADSQQTDSQANSSGYETQTQMTSQDVERSQVTDTYSQSNVNWLESCQEYMDPKYKKILEDVDFLTRVFQSSLIHPASLVDPVCKAIEGLHVALPMVLLDGISNLTPFKMTVNVVTSSLSSYWLCELPMQLEESLGNFIQKLIQVVMDTTRGTTQDELASLLVHLALNPYLISAALIRMVACIADFASQLRRAVQGVEQLNRTHYSNVRFIFNSLEHVMWTSPLVRRSQDSCRAIKQELDDSLLFLSSHFPDFAEKVWRTGALLSRLINQSTED
eukprot:m.9764 g.9764  ORF g.9764 m.9764 type:complete len:356 (+) comp21618_c0_seq1:64-1131(+)